MRAARRTAGVGRTEEDTIIAGAKRTAGVGEDRRSRSGRVRRPGRGREGNSAVINNPTVRGSEMRRLRNLRFDSENEKK